MNERKQKTNTEKKEEIGNNITVAKPTKKKLPPVPQTLYIRKQKQKAMKPPVESFAPVVPKPLKKLKKGKRKKQSLNQMEKKEEIGNNMENKLNNLLWLNERLKQFGEEPQSSKTKALNLLKTKVFINIYDLEAEKYERRTTKEKLNQELIVNPKRRFPLHIAKGKKNLSIFLINM